MLPGQHLMMMFHMLHRASFRRRNKGGNKCKVLDFSFKYGVTKRENPTDGIKDPKALLLLVPSPFKEMM